MDEIQELLLDPQFRKYRRQELKAGVQYVRERIFTDPNGAELKGALEMLRRIIKLPSDFSLGEVAQERVNAAVQSDMDWLNVHFVKESIEDE